ncbi:MAG: hypothetical protein WC802_00960 [Patescibacteria group bacterium]|jgi:hypothetical protein
MANAMLQTFSAQPSVGTAVPTTETAKTQQPVIQIGLVESALGVAVILIGVGVAWGTLKTQVANVAATLKDRIEPDLKDIRERFMSVETKVETLWRDRVAPAHSPRQLNTLGKEILNNSGIKEIIDGKREIIIAKVRERAPKNAFDAEQVLYEVMGDLQRTCPDIVEKLKEGAFKVGADIPALLFVAAIDLRDRILPELGFNPKDIDMHVAKDSHTV